MAATKDLANIEKVYRDKVVQQLIKKFDYGNVFEVPRLKKIVLNMGLGSAKDDPKILDSAVSDLAAITGQRPLITKAKTSVAGFNIRAGAQIGCKVTLRRDRMYEFFDRLVNVAIPRIRDFRGLNPKSFDGRGNYSFGVEEQVVFPEIDYDNVSEVRGMDITIVTSAKTDEEAKELITLLGMPLRKD
ncbi:MAG TPA: 50S ribosomal protein L5 [Candidatus Krumholzibacteriaceae bacterium]|nr:50S ribosomal protein L5 [Candidatus Krumholzibacteriaceae bacterium]